MRTKERVLGIMKKFIEDFKSFAIKGNIMDLAIGVIIGGAFGKIVTSLVNDIITPLLGLLMGKMDLSEIGYAFKGTDVVLKYGAFLQNIIDFLIISLSIFVVIRFLNQYKKKQEAKTEAVAEVKITKEEELLTEIRDLLKNRNNE